MFQEELHWDEKLKKWEPREKAFHDVFPKQPFLVTNYKCRFQCRPFKNCFQYEDLKTGEQCPLEDKLSPHKARLTRVSGNSCTIRTERHGVFIVFCSGTVNHCGLPTRKRVESAVDFFNDTLLPAHALSKQEQSLVVDNISLSGHLGQEGIGIPNFRKFMDSAARALNIPYSYDGNRFSGATLRPFYASLILFPSGALNCMGVATPDQVHKVQHLLTQLLIQLQKHHRNYHVSSVL